VSARGERTREHLIDVAEVLYGRRGFQNVSLREIQTAAGQRNAGALHYHFGDRDGLLSAIVARHMPRLDQRQDELLAVANESDGDLRSHVAVLVAPFAEYVDRGSSERAWVQICAELLVRPSTTFDEIRRRSNSASFEAGVVIYNRMLEIVPADIAIERAIAVPLGAIYVCADRARILEHPKPRRAVLPGELFVANLVDLTTSAFAAEPGPVIAAHRAPPGETDSRAPARARARPKAPAEAAAGRAHPTRPSR
jgi:AcrR family transcriptional regulator